MAYDNAFFAAYARYLEEPRVRRVHDNALHWFDRVTETYRRPMVVDIGCGMGEFYRRGKWHEYCGVDLKKRPEHPAAEGTATSKVIEAEYMGIDEWLDQVGNPNTFVSLFSLEPVLGPRVAAVYYTTLFGVFPSLERGLSVGFYYADERATDPTVLESGDVVSHQSNDLLGTYPIRGVREQRLIVPCPSDMFGESVVEVWKAFSRGAVT